MRTASPPIPRRRRPHPAQRARKIAGTVSVAGMVLLTGCMAAAGKTSGTTAATTAATGSTVTTATTPATTASDDWSTSRSITASAVGGTTSSQSDTSTNAS